MRIDKPQGLITTIFLKATTLGLNSAIRRVVIKVIDCIDQTLQTKYPDGMTVKYTAKTGIHYISID